MRNKGLTDLEVIENRKKYGTNSLMFKRENSFLKLFIESLGDPIIKILLIVLAVKTVFLFKNFDWFETLGIIIAILLASVISAVSEYSSNKSFVKLENKSSELLSSVLRNGEINKIRNDEIVVNDLILIYSGNVIPADGKIIEGNLTVDESSFTGEKKEITKLLSDNVYRGSSNIKGNAIIKVTNVGRNTKYGEISLELMNKTPDSPLKIRLKELAHFISKIGYIGAILVFFSYLISVLFIQNDFNISIIKKIINSPQIIFGHIIYALTLAVTIIIVSVPEGLPMMIALVLSSNMKKMVKDNVLVRHMVGIETSGCINTLISDKTGTITKGDMEVVGIILGNGDRYNKIEELGIQSRIYNSITKNMFLNNESKVDSEGNVINGNMTDKSIFNCVKNLKIADNILEKEYFSSDKKYSSIVIDDDIRKSYIKGAPDVLLNSCSEYLSKDGSRKKIDYEIINNNILKYTKMGYRVILLCEKNSKYSKNMIFNCILLLKDEIKENAPKAIDMLKRAGINTIMVTGDAKDTAINIGREIGLIKDDNDLILSSREFNLMSNEMIKKRFYDIKIIARALPKDKNRLVKIGQQKGLLIGMTGDGVNDAPALKNADVGFAMGSGSEISKEASDIIILDNDLLSISKAVLYGRTIFKSIRKFIIFQLSMNICALLLSIIGPFIGINTPITVIQMLWINMIMDTLAGLAYSYEPALKEYLELKPIKKNTPIINEYMFSNILVSGIYSAIILLIFLKVPFFKLFFSSNGNDHFMTAFFGLFVFMGIVSAFISRTNRLKILSNILSNKIFLLVFGMISIIQTVIIYKGGNTFRTYGLTINEFIFILIIAITIIPVDLMRKIILKRLNKNTGV